MVRPLLAGWVLGALLSATTASAAGAFAAANAADAFDTLSNVQTDTELPAESSGASSSISRTLRPALSYPTLRLNNAAPRPAPTQAETPVPPPSPTASQSEFDAMVEQTLGRPLARFGSGFFQGRSPAFPAVDQVNVPADFVLGPGDEVSIRAWGSIDLDYRTTIDRTGNITIPKVGDLSLTGVRFGELRDVVDGALRRSFHGYELNVSLGQLRSVRVYVTGFARDPGAYTVNSLSTLINLVFASGGPGQVGDLRRVELRRSGVVKAQIDLYQFLVDGDRSGDLRLLPEDVIYVPPMRGQAAIAGSVNVPAIFQLRERETLRDLLHYAGGLSTSASGNKVVIERIANGVRRTVEESLLDASALDRPIQDGDLVMVVPVSPKFANVVTLKGHVAQPIRHEWRPKMRISDLIPSVDALVEPGYWTRHNARTQIVDLLAATPKISFRPDFPSINWEYAVVERIQRDSVSVTMIPVHLGRIVRDHDASADIELEPGDTLTVFSLTDFRTPVDQNGRFVRIEGEVQRAGVYTMAPGETLIDLINKAGGLTRNAYLFGTEVTRESVRAAQQRRIDSAVDQLERDFQRHLIDRSRNVLSGDLSIAIPSEADAIHNLVSRLRAVKASGRIVLGLEPRGLDMNDLPALPLEDGDTVTVPVLPRTIELVGALYQQGSTLYRPGQTVAEHLRNAAFITTADRRATYVVRPDGSVVTAVSRLRLMPGDAIVVPERVERETFVRRFKDWTQVLYQFGLGAAGLKILTGY